ncbi:putative dehydrogenase [Parabacteroides sp. PF5-5]|uniref:Gfo/Idh/MocA family protein n=1 Tax=unclassified Parabacteroides TaxID=2649774 RepID=UPI0024736B0E|nr:MULTISPECIES: Gfo/Idh/MocA family oxidoreductase [unclassified Parabacteroides]MDH6305458.1 putative dehydrogenase [Parabacteroides sp. PH5-39]MDH6316168.1 putative dehydrogenase [Parabacteroides sp. PF5-13]MDH6320318.1 putative dehydrogenase [Parabacteroides sp. PH5-13]MDH6324048.1 putative dehydrogenase [Parabacteroides sp. PH5-8]MDH6327359.1 putative dehydrogenase [Parabacteroides sp. PH5-41]
MNRKKVTRRRFIQGLSAAFALPYIIPATAWGRGYYIAPSDRITLGFIGCGEHGIGTNIKGFLKHDDCQILSICDVDPVQLQKAREAILEKYGTSYSSLSAGNDFRDVINRKDIDAVCISTPDHWHIQMGVMAARIGKDLFVEKPLTVSVEEGKVFCNVIRETGRVVQVGSEQRCRPEFHKMAEIVRNGVIGDLKHIEVGMPSGHPIRENYNDKRMPLEACSPPEGFDYEMWTGPAPMSPYCPGRTHWNWRWVEELAEGQFNDYAHHLIDIAQWAHGTEDILPISVEGSGTFPEGYYTTATDYDCLFTFADGVTMRCKSGRTGHRFEGSKGVITNTGWGKLSADPESILDFRTGSGDVKLFTAESEHRNFLDCVKSRQKCYSHEGIGHRASVFAHIGIIAMKLGRKLQFDPVSETFVNDPEANKMLTHPRRGSWTL